MEKLSSIAAILFVLSAGIKYVEGLNETVWDIPVLLPENDTCIRKALELGFQDIRNERINGQLAIYRLEPHFYEATSDIADLVDLTNQIHKHSIFKYDGLTFPADLKKLTEITKKLTIGPPYPEQSVIYGEFAFVLPTLQVSYTEISEPYDSSLKGRLQLPPSIAGIIRAGRKFMESMKWEHVIIIYDFSNSRYRLSVNKMEEHLLTKINGKSINVAYKARIRTELDDIRIEELARLLSFEARIVFLMVGVAGARQTFCQAYHLELHKSNFIWILFEELPDEWATDKFNVFNEKTGKYVREIECTPEQLYSVAGKYIFITRGGIRRDKKKVVNNGTAEDFIKRLQAAVGPRIKCNDSAAYAYDSVWASVRLLQRTILFKALFGTFEQSFAYTFGFVFQPKLERTKTLFNVSFEGVTGPVSYKLEPLFRKHTRAGPNSIFFKRQGETSIWIGGYDTTDNDFNLVDNAKQIIFGSNEVPSDRPQYSHKEYNYPEGYVITIWTVACLGALVTLFLSLVVTAFTSDKEENKILNWVDLIISFGCIACFASLICYGLDTRFIRRDWYGGSCMTFLCTLSLGFTFTFGGLFAKTWWKYKCYNAPSVQGEKREFPEFFILLLIFIFFAIDVVVLVIWHEVSPFTYVVSNPSNVTLTFVTEIQEIIKCDGVYQNQFLIGIYCYKGVMLVFGLFLAWQTTSQANKGTGLSSSLKGDHVPIFNTVLVSIVGVVCVSLLEDTTHRHALYTIVAICVILCTSITLTIIYIPKINSMLYPFGSDESSNGSDENNKFNKFTFKQLRKRVTGARSAKYPSVSSMATVSTAASSVDSRRNTAVPMSEINNDPQRRSSYLSEGNGSLGTYPTFSVSPRPNEPTIFEVSTEEPMDEIIANVGASNDINKNTTVDEDNAEYEQVIENNFAKEDDDDGSEDDKRDDPKA